MTFILIVSVLYPSHSVMIGGENFPNSIAPTGEIFEICHTLLRG